MPKFTNKELKKAIMDIKDFLWHSEWGDRPDYKTHTKKEIKELEKEMKEIGYA